MLTHEWHVFDHACASTAIYIFTGQLHDLVWK
jgi:hypothetical protein